jgi:soluble lytic murein transglycosylase-like protein
VRITRTQGTVAAAAAIVLVALVGGIYLVSSNFPSAKPPAFAQVPPGAGLAATSAPPQASPSDSPSPSPTKPKPKPTPSRKPVTIPGPPPPAPAPSPAPSGVVCPYHYGTDAPQAEVAAALEAAAAHHFWTTSPVNLPVSLIKAIAKQESGWQSTIVACDGGIGTMQIMPNTASWMNQRFGTHYDVKTLSGNTMIGSAYLQWLIKYFGDVYFNGDYQLSTDDCSLDPNVADYLEPCLLNAVIAAYNYGYGKVDTPNGLVIPNPNYVRPVRALMLQY